jgi:hypothetical protein
MVDATVEIFNGYRGVLSEEKKNALKLAENIRLVLSPEPTAMSLHYSACLAFGAEVLYLATKLSFDLSCILHLLASPTFSDGGALPLSIRPPITMASSQKF